MPVQIILPALPAVILILLPATNTPHQGVQTYKYFGNTFYRKRNQLGTDQLVLSLSSQFVVKDPAALDFFLGIKLTRKSNTIMLSQKYALYLSEHNIMIKVKPLKTQHLLNPNSLTMVVNCLCMQHIILVSCLDLCYTVNQVCFCMKTYTLPEAVNRILRCVKGSMNYVIRF